MATARRSPAGRSTRPAGAWVTAGALALGLLVSAAGCAGTMSAADEDPGTTAAHPSTADARGEASLAAPETKDSPEPLVTASPDEHSEVGDLVEGFPIDLLPVPTDAVILVTSAVPVGDAEVQEVSLNLTTSATAEELLTLYRDALTGAGFTEVAPLTATTDLAVDSTFTRSGGDELVSIGVLDEDGVRTVTIGGRVHTTR